MKKFVALAALAFIAAHASAADKTWYIGGDVGSSQFKALGDSERKTGYGATLGYSLNPNVAFELQARRLGKWKDGSSTLSADALQASVLGIVPISKEFSMYGRLGASRNTLDLSQGNLNYSLRSTKTVFGFGGDYALDKNLSLRAEYSNLGKHKIGTNSGSVDVKVQQVNLGLNYGF